MKIDLRKVYDSVHWESVGEMMVHLKFPPKFIEWVMACVSTPTFTISMNGEES